MPGQEFLDRALRPTTTSILYSRPHAGGRTQEMKRKADPRGDEAEANGHSKRAATGENGLPKATGLQDSDAGVPSRFGPGILDSKTIESCASSYARSAPYQHAVVSRLINDDLLRSVRQEILENIHFTRKETDIYKIHQSGDLANLDGLDPSSLSKLPSLLQLRDALYSSEFRRWISAVSGAGPVSGRKTDMAVNVYVPGCHLLCHDDVIGTRRVSYILYLTDPDEPWREEWGGALRLYAVEEKVGEDGGKFKVPRAEWEKVIPPKWNQLSFFAVRPGQSFHDVEEVYHPSGGEGKGERRVRMAISGWFHIPQEGEDGFEPGLEEKMAERSSLQQLQGRAEQFDEPQDVWFEPGDAVAAAGRGKGKGVVDDAEEDGELSEDDLNFLLKFMTPNYLTPDTVEELQELFAEESTLQLSNFLSPKFAAKLKDHFAELGSSSDSVPEMQVSRPPHKHRYQYLQPSIPAAPSEDPWKQVLNELLPSLAFRKWLALATGLGLGQCTVLGRRFRRGLDYQLAQSYDGEDPMLEYTLGITPTPGWGADEAAAEDGDDAESGTEVNGAGAARKQGSGADGEEEDNVGGYELYMAGDDEPGDDNASNTSEAVNIPASAKPTIQSSTGAGHRRKAKADPAIYKSATDEEDDGILFSNPATWNTLSVVLRDRGTLRFVKYVSKKARGDRWDFAGGFEVLGDGEEDAEDEGQDEDGAV